MTKLKKLCHNRRLRRKRELQRLPSEAVVSSERKRKKVCRFLKNRVIIEGSADRSEASKTRDCFDGSLKIYS
ncbi:hypothetical protein, partial [Variovorax ginsengisoli]